MHILAVVGMLGISQLRLPSYSHFASELPGRQKALAVSGALYAVSLLALLHHLGRSMLCHC
eukprot:1582233-Amphidinium_carterae.1